MSFIKKIIHMAILLTVSEKIETAFKLTDQCIKENYLTHISFENINTSCVKDRFSSEAVTPLLYAVIKKNPVEIIELLLEKKADPNRTDSNGRTPLHTTFCPKITRLLLEYSADPNLQDNEGNTALHFYKRPFFCKEIDALTQITLLYRYGADLNIKNFQNETPLLTVPNFAMLQHLIFLGATPCEHPYCTEKRNLWDYANSKAIIHDEITHIQAQRAATNNILQIITTDADTGLPQLPIELENIIIDYAVGFWPGPYLE